MSKPVAAGRYYYSDRLAVAQCLYAPINNAVAGVQALGDLHLIVGTDADADGFRDRFTKWRIWRMACYTDFQRSGTRA
jgi:hypothetical protein